MDEITAVNDKEVEEDPFFADKEFCQKYGFRYIRKNEMEHSVKEKMGAAVDSAFYSVQHGTALIRCNCVVDKSGVKCNDDKCALASQMIECGKECGDGCQNQKIDKLDPDFLLISTDDVYGIVVSSTKMIPKETVIGEYVGIVEDGVVPSSQKLSYPLTRLHLDMDMHINCTEAGNEFRLLSHSSNPNCVIHPWVVGRELRLIVVACQEIDNGDVLTLCYPHLENATTMYGLF